MTLSVDKSKVSEGEIIEVKWAANNADELTLTLNNGVNSTTVQVEKEGSKKFRLNRVGQTTLTITTIKGGKKSQKSQKVKVTAKKYDTYERVGDNKIKDWWHRSASKMKNYFSRLKYGWSVMPRDKKQASTSLTIILAIMIISSFFPSAVFFGLSVLAIYCFYILMKK